MENGKQDYEERARAALVLLQEAVRASGVPDAKIDLKRDVRGVLHVVAKSGGHSHRLEIVQASGYLRLTKVMQNILQAI